MKELKMYEQEWNKFNIYRQNSILNLKSYDRLKTMQRALCYNT